MNKTKVVLGVSGGMDSTVLLHTACQLFDEVYAVSFNYGQRHIKEIECANLQIQDVRQKYPEKQINHQTIDVTFIRELAPTSSLTNNSIETPNVKDIRGEAQPKSYVPNRNMIFLSILAARAEAVKSNLVWHGAAEADSLAGYWDGSPEFLLSINSLLGLNRDNPITIDAPLIKLSKKQIVLDGVKLGVKFENTWTCYAGKELSDAESASSSLRLQGFIGAGYRDPLRYIQQEKLDVVYKAMMCKKI